MSVRVPKYSKEDHARMGRELYEGAIRAKVEEGNIGRIVAIDVDSGDFELGDTTGEAGDKLLKYRPDAQIWCERIGFEYVYKF